MHITEDDIVRQVRVALDENTQTTMLADDTDTLEMDDIIRSKIPDAVNSVRVSTPAWTLGEESLRLMASAAQDDGDDALHAIVKSDGSGMAVLPDDCLKPVSLMVSGWLRPVTEFITPEHPLYQRQHSRFSGVRGNPSRPVAVLRASATNLVSAETRPGRIVEFFSAGETEATVSLVYAARCDGPSDGGYDIEDGLVRQVIMKTAALTAATYGEAKNEEQGK